MADETAPEGATTDAGDTGTSTATLPDGHPLVLAHKRLKAQLGEAQGELRKHEDANKSEMQKLQDAVAERDKQLTDLPGTVRSQAIKFASLAGSLGFIDPEDALLGIGNVDLADEDAVKTALTKLAERKPHLVRQEPAKRRTAERPKPKTGGQAEGTDDGRLTGKERAAAALREFSKAR